MPATELTAGSELERGPKDKLSNGLLYLPAALIASILCGAVLIRAWILAGPLGTLDSDEAIVGLMARHILDGEFTAFYWGQWYGGSHEALLAAPLFALFGSQTLVLKIVPLVLSAVSALLVWRIGIRTIGDQAAKLAAGLFVIWPPFFVWWSVKERGTYWAGLVLALTFVLLITRLEPRDPREVKSRELVLVGVVAGLGWWATPQVIYLMLPAGIWLLATRPAFFRKLWIVLPGAAAGAIPWIAFNLRTQGGTFRVPPQPQPNSFLSHLAGFFEHALPRALGLKLSYSEDWLVPVVGMVAYVALIAAFAFYSARVASRRGPLVLIAGTAFIYPALFSLSPFSWFTEDPRYLLFLSPVLVMLLSRGVLSTGSRRPALLLLVAALGVTVGALYFMNARRLYSPQAGGVPVPDDMSSLISTLEAHRARRVITDYWIAYRLSFESQEEIIATPFSSVRYRPHDRLVRESGSPAYVFVNGSSEVDVFSRSLSERAVRYSRVASGGFIVFIPIGV